MLVSFSVFNMKGFHFDGVKKGYFLWVILLFVSNGIYGILMDGQQKVMQQTQRSEMIIITFLFSALISAVYLSATQKKQTLTVFQMNGKNWLYALGSSACAALAINILMLTLRLVPASVLYTVNNGGVLILCALSGAVIFHDKLEKHMILGIGITILGLVLLSI